MPRPVKWRKVCCLPESNIFGPLNGKVQEDQLVMSIDEYETIRLIDLERLNQEECAERMNVARATVQKIYTDARYKLAEALVNGYILKIEGGEYKLYDQKEQMFGCRRCRKDRCSSSNYNKQKEEI